MALGMHARSRSRDLDIGHKALMP
eukprot:COSAG01_NODE_63393_length_280_cov_0.629834_1_plen_23_part_10